MSCSPDFEKDEARIGVVNKAAFPQPLYFPHHAADGILGGPFSFLYDNLYAKPIASPSEWFLSTHSQLSVIS